MFINFHGGKSMRHVMHLKGQILYNKRRRVDLINVWIALLDKVRTSVILLLLSTLRVLQRRFCVLCS